MEDKSPNYDQGAGSGLGNSPKVSTGDMEASNRVITSVEQAIELTETDIYDARKLIKAAAQITSKKQGAPPYNQALLTKQGKNSKSNFSTRFLQKELNRAAPRLYMPILTASTMTAAELPAGWPKAQEKNQFFQKTITQAIRGWRKNDMFWRGHKQEVCDYGYDFIVWPDTLEWRPSLCRMDRGFVPRGTEVMDDKLARFTLKLDYRPDELLSLVRRAVDAESDNWKKDSVAMAVDRATSTKLAANNSQLRKWEELIREQATNMSTTRTQRMIETRHLWVLEFSGKVSHYILWPDGPKDSQLLFEHLDERDSMDEVVIPTVFGYGDGTIQGSWGLGHLLYDLAAKVEKVRCDSVDNLLNSNKARLQVPNAKDIAQVQLAINDTTIIASGAQFAQNVGGITGDPKGYLLLDDRMTRWAQEIAGSYLPPIPSQASKAATDISSEAIANEQQVQKDVLELSLKQDALVIANMIKRMLDPDTDDDYALGIQKKLLGDQPGWIKKTFGKLVEKIEMLKKIIPPQPTSLTLEELAIFVNQPVIQSVSDFTEFAAQQRGAFAASVQNNPLFNQSTVARAMAEGVQNAGRSFVDSIVVPEGDTTSITVQQRQQTMEMATMITTKQPLPVAVVDNHWVHWGVLEPQLAQAIQAGAIPQAKALIVHLSAHFAAGQSTKTWPPDQINASKARLAQLQRALEAKEQEVAAAQAQQVQLQQGQQVGQPQIQPQLQPGVAA